MEKALLTQLQVAGMLACNVKLARIAARKGVGAV